MMWTSLMVLAQLATVSASLDYCDIHEEDCCDRPILHSILLYRQPTGEEAKTCRFAAVAADTRECSDIGVRLMAQEGGSVVDAAIAAHLCTGVMNSYCLGIGGGHVSLYYHRNTRRMHSVVARTEAPSAAHKNMYKNNFAGSIAGGTSVAVPGDIRGLWELHKLGGRLPWKRLFQPVIKMCREGFRVTLASINALRKKEEYLEKYESFREYMTDPATGEMYERRARRKLPVLARTLEAIAEEGPQTFYNGSLAARILADLYDIGSIITAKDLASYRPTVEEPVKFRLHGNLTVHSSPLPTGGPVLLYILNILNDYKFTKKDVTTIENASLTYHRIVEAFKHASAVRSQMGDTQTESPTYRTFITQLLRNLTDPDVGAAVRHLIDDDRTYNVPYYRPRFEPSEDHGTSHVSVVGPDGDAVAMTGTLNIQYGSKEVGSRTGILFNNAMQDFSQPGFTNYHNLPPSPANFIKPRKRPLSSMSPVIVTGRDDEAVLVTGSSGGPRILTANAMTLIQTLMFKWDLKKAVDYGRLHHQLLPNEIQVSKTFPKSIQDRLATQGHVVREAHYVPSAVQAIRRVGDRIIAYSDWRKGGVADCY